jgi:hypothetical protein
MGLAAGLGMVLRVTFASTGLAALNHFYELSRQWSFHGQNINVYVAGYDDWQSN